MTSSDLKKARRLLCSLQDRIRSTLIAARKRGASRFAEIAAVTAADTIYHVDKISEEAILEWFEESWPKAWPVELVMEGIEDEPVTFPAATAVAKTIWKCIIDPIDGTRNLMYDKRSAWILTGLAPQRGTKNRLGDIIVAAMTELPTSKMWRSDQVSGIRGQGPKGIIATAHDVRTGHNSPLHLRPLGCDRFPSRFRLADAIFSRGESAHGEDRGSPSGMNFTASARRPRRWCLTTSTSRPAASSTSCSVVMIG